MSSSPATSLFTPPNVSRGRANATNGLDLGPCPQLKWQKSSLLTFTWVRDVISLTQGRPRGKRIGCSVMSRKVRLHLNGQVLQKPGFCCSDGLRKRDGKDGSRRNVEEKRKEKRAEYVLTEAKVSSEHGTRHEWHGLENASRKTPAPSGRCTSPRGRRGAAGLGGSR